MTCLAVHDSQKTDFRQPFGAVSVSTKVSLKLMLTAEAEVILRIWLKNAGEVCIPMSIKAIDVDTYGYYAEYIVPDKPCLIWYYFIIKQAQNTFYYGNNTFNSWESQS